ncbi:hypothetical protein [Okeania sp. KiyG1]|uniref:hypothetical protein n=1 Tax=Okeania sp. KiyG1 TaxID=2720165 RepID=UPI001920BFFE|nr:hypothetical protein [Okeania sp. KiyG1]GGA44207.1 hypothetical protein CYANOKiyG1_62920 [Okeania sp. KiyG1]
MIVRVMESKSIYQELDRDELIQTFSNNLEKVSLKITISLDDERLTKKVRGVMSIEFLMIFPQSK